MEPPVRRAQFLEMHKKVYADSSKQKGLATCVEAIMHKMQDPNKRLVAAKPDAADALSAALKERVENPECNVIGAIADAGSSFRINAESPFAVALSWARPSNANARFGPEEVRKIESEEGKRMLWLPFARLQRDMSTLEKCATYVCVELCVKMFHLASSGGTTFRDDVLFHAVDLFAALTEREETFIKRERRDGSSRNWWIKVPDGWEDLAREMAPLTLGAFLGDLDGYPVIVLASKTVIVLARQFYEQQGWEFEMWPDNLIACAGVDPSVVRLDGSRHADGMPAYGVGQVSKNGRVFLVACVTAAGDAIYGGLAPVIGGSAYGAAHLTGNVNILISVCTNGKLVEYDDERCAFVANGAVKAASMRKAVEAMKSGGYAKDLAARRSIAAQKAAAKTHARKDAHGKSISAQKAAAKTHARKDAHGKSISAQKAAATTHARKDAHGKSISGKKSAATIHARKDAHGKSIAGKKRAATKNARKDAHGKSIAGKKTAATKSAAKDAAAKLMCVYKDKKRSTTVKVSYFYQKSTQQKGPPLSRWGFDSELAAAVALNDHLASLSLSPLNKGWFNAEEERKKKWKEEWERERAE